MKLSEVIKEPENVKIVQPNKDVNRYIVTMNITLGKLYSIRNALENHKTPVGEDILYLLNEAMKTLEPNV